MALRKFAAIVFTFIFVLSALAVLTFVPAPAHATINSLSGWTVVNGGTWSVANSTFTLTTASNVTNENGWSFLVNNTYLPDNYEISVKVYLAADYDVGIFIYSNYTNHINFLASTYAGSSNTDSQFEIATEINGTRTYLNSEFGSKVSVGGSYYLRIIKNGTTFTFYAGTDNSTGATASYTITNPIFLNNVHLALVGQEENDQVTLYYVKTLGTTNVSQEFNTFGFHRFEYTPNHWYKIVPYHSGEYSYIAFTNNYNMGQTVTALKIDYLDANFTILKEITGPTVNGELYPMKINGQILLIGHDGSSAYIGIFNPSTGTVQGTDVSGQSYLTDVMYDCTTKEYFILAANNVAFFYETTQANLLNPSAWIKINIPSQYIPNANIIEFRATIWHNYIYLTSRAWSQNISSIKNYVIRYDINNKTFQEITSATGANFDYPRSDYNTVTYAERIPSSNGYTAYYYASHDGIHFKQIFTTTLPITNNINFENHTYALPILNSEYYYIAATHDGGYGKYFIIDENGTVLYNITVTEAAHTTLADPILLQNGLIEGTEKWTRVFWPANGWVNDSYIQAMMFQKLPISVSTENNGGTPVQATPNTVIYAIEPYNGSIGMFYWKSDITGTVYVNANGYNYNIGTIAQEHGNYLLIEPATNSTGNNTNNGTGSGGGGLPTNNSTGLMNLLMKKVDIAGYAVPMWVLVAATFVVIIALAARRH